MLDYEPETWEVAHTDPWVTAYDDGAGAFEYSGGGPGSIDYAQGIVQWQPEVELMIPHPTWRTEQLGSELNERGVAVSVFRRLFAGWELIPSGAAWPDDLSGKVTVRYRLASGDATETEVFAVATLELDLTRGYGEAITSGSAQFTLGNSRYVSTGGLIYRDPSPETGAGSAAGTLDPTTGRVALTSWPAGGANTVTLHALLTEIGGQPVDEVTFRAVTSPLRPGSLQLRWTDLPGNTYSKTPDATGILEDADCRMAVDFTRGVIRARFGVWRPAADLTPEELLEGWYSAAAVVDRDGVQSIWKPQPARAGTLVYNAVAQTTLPPDSDLIGIDAARMPPDGKALIFRPSMLVLVHHTGTLAAPSLSAGQVLDCGRTRLYRVVIEDSTGARVPADQYVVDRAAGTVTMADPLDLSGLVAPYSVRHMIADLRRVRSTDISGRLELLGPVTHDSYATEGGYVSGLLFFGTRQARVSGLFAQATWTGQWSDSLIGDAPLASYNAAAYPITTTNAGAVQDRIMLRFTGTTAFDAYGEQLGYIGSGAIGEDFAPLNPLTGQTYCTVPAAGWGGGWSSGNVLRFNLIAASHPVAAVRAVQPSEATGEVDDVELLLIGNVDA